MADQLMDMGSSDEAITEYRRFLFFNPQGEETGYALYRLGLAYRANRDWRNAIEAFESSISAAETPKIADERRIILGTTLIASGNQSLARLELLEVSEFSEYPLLRWQDFEQ